MDSRTFLYGQRNITYNILFSKRKTMEIAVHPDSTITVKAPMSSDISSIEKKLYKRARWIFRQVKYFQQFRPKTPNRCYVNGETHLYLGKQYRLKISTGPKNEVKLRKGFFQVVCQGDPSPEKVKELMKSWYLEKAKIHFEESFYRCWEKFSSFGFEKPKISIRYMKKRWGSLSSKGTMTLNTHLIKAPKECIDYVITHELCHLKYRHHNAEFYHLLYSLTPGWEKIKHKLELSMA